jgi:hypothetical protein
MEHMKKPLVFLKLSVLLAFLFCAACVEPAPLYGTWSDNRGNTFSFYDDGTFNSKITVPGGIKYVYEGNYSVLLNSLTLTCTNTELKVVTEWDIRGNMLYFDWINEDGNSLSMTLYKVSN